MCITRLKRCDRAGIEVKQKGMDLEVGRGGNSLANSRSVWTARKIRRRRETLAKFHPSLFPHPSSGRSPRAMTEITPSRREQGKVYIAQREDGGREEWGENAQGSSWETHVSLEGFGLG